MGIPCGYHGNDGNKQFEEYVNWKISYICLFVGDVNYIEWSRGKFKGNYGDFYGSSQIPTLYYLEK